MSGFKIHYYRATAKLPSRCSLWKFSVVVSSLNNPINLNPQINLNNLYLEATLNNVLFQGNTSAYFLYTPIAYGCVNEPFSYTVLAIDVNSLDSVVTEIINPITRLNACTDVISNIPLSNTTPPLSIPYNPIQTNNTTTIDHNGTINCMPFQAGVNALVTRTKEYRNGVLVGSVIRHSCIQIMNYANDTVQFTIDASSVSGGALVNDTIQACAEQILSFCYDVKAKDSMTSLQLEDHSFAHLENSTSIYSGQFTDSVRICTTWTPTSKDAVLKQSHVISHNVTCKPPGIVFRRSFPITINIWPPTQIINDTFICLGQSARLHAQNGGNYTWSVISGSGASLNCYNCDTVTATPNFTTKYEVVSAASAFCSNNRDTVTVGVWPSIKSKISIQASDTVITEGQITVFNSLGVNCSNPVYQWKINGANVPGADSNIFVFNNFIGVYTITCTVACSDTCVDSPLATSNSIDIVVTPVSTSVAGTINAYGYKVYPNPNKGEFTLAGKLPAGNIDIAITNRIGQVVYHTSWNEPVTGFVNRHMNAGMLADGMYILTIKTNDEASFIRVNVMK
jgi:hypothetical protein